jgi:hypothetical protein
MRSILLALLVGLIGVGVFVGCNSSESKGAAAAQNKDKKGDQVQTVYADGARRITIVEAQDLIKKGQSELMCANRSRTTRDTFGLQANQRVRSWLDDYQRQDNNHVLFLTKRNTSAGAVVSLKSKNVTNAGAFLVVSLNGKRKIPGGEEVG